MSPKFLAQTAQELVYRIPVLRIQRNRVGKEIGEKLIFGYMCLEVSFAHQFRRPQHGPSAQRKGNAVVFFASDLSGGDSDNRPIAGLHGADAVRQVLRELPLNEQPIDAVIVQTGAHPVLQFVEMHHTDQRVQFFRPDVPGIYIRLPDIQQLFHDAFN